LAKLDVRAVRQRALEIVAANPGGIRWAPLLYQIRDEHPETPLGTISGSCRNLDKLFPKLVSRPARGLYKPVGIEDTTAEEPIDANIIATKDAVPRLQESRFYQAFADWLEDDLGEVTGAASLGGSGFGGKWATPDVVGVYRATTSDLIKFQPEIVSAEIKIDYKQPVVAFGQAIAYRLFSAKTYIAMPRQISEEDAARLEALCLLFGMGFVLFDLDPANPNFRIRVRAQRFAPDMFYVNSFAERMKGLNGKMFKELFG
jgi:hypothetical protein